MHGSSQDARERLLEAAAEVFASKGYAQASTREICRLAGANVAAIHYYFGDKASLYREIFRPASRLLELPDELVDPNVSLRDALVAFYRHVLNLAGSSKTSQYMRMVFAREQLEPTGVLHAGQAEVLRPFHDRLLQFVVARLEAAEPDVELHQLAFSLVGLVMVMLVERGTAERLVPGLLDDADAVEATVQRLADSAFTLIHAERERRSLACATHVGERHGANSPTRARVS
jgi:AcrR family transcriptional regulator